MTPSGFGLAKKRVLGRKPPFCCQGHTHLITGCPGVLGRLVFAVRSFRLRESLVFQDTKHHYETSINQDTIMVVRGSNKFTKREGGDAGTRHAIMLSSRRKHDTIGTTCLTGAEWILR